MVSPAVQWLKNRDPEFPVPMVDAVQAAREMPLADHGAFDGNQNAVKIKSDDKINVDNVNIDFKPKGGNRKEYLLRRLSRDFPQALDRIQAGELSTRKAAIEYGIIKVKTPMQIIMSKVGELVQTELTELQAYIQNKGWRNFTPSSHVTT